jgi:putative endonuclease
MGVTNDLVRRVYQHRQRRVDGFTKKYNLTWLVHFEASSDVLSAIAREKEIKGWRRSNKVALIEATNPRWKDLTRGWYDEGSEAP